MEQCYDLYKYKNEMCRVYVSLTIISVDYSFIISEPLGEDETFLVVLFPDCLWSIDFFGLWIIKGFLRKK